MSPGNQSSGDYNRRSFAICAADAAQFSLMSNVNFFVNKCKQASCSFLLGCCFIRGPRGIVSLICDLH